MATSSLGQDLGPSGRVMSRGKHFNKAQGHPRQFFLRNQSFTSMTSSSLPCIKDPGLGEIPMCCIPAASCISLYSTVTRRNYLFYACVLQFIWSSPRVGTSGAFPHCSLPRCLAQVLELSGCLTNICGTIVQCFILKFMIKR